MRDVTSYTATVSFPAASIDDTVSDNCVVYYHVEAKDKVSGAVYFSKSVAADRHMGIAARDTFTVELTGLAHGVGLHPVGGG